MEHALDRIPGWIWSWRRSGRLVLLLDFDGTLSPIVPHAEDARLTSTARIALGALRDRIDVDVAIVSGRAIEDLRSRVDLEGLLFAGNHGMEIEGPGVSETAPQALALRPALERAKSRITAGLESVSGAWVEDKGLTLTIHLRQADPADEERIRQIVASGVEGEVGLRLTCGKKVIEVRPAVDYDKGTAVQFLLRHLDPPVGSPVLYLGDDTTDEDAFRVVKSMGDPPGEGVVVADPVPTDSAATAFLKSVDEVGDLLAALAVQER